MKLDDFKNAAKNGVVYDASVISEIIQQMSNMHFDDLFADEKYLEYAKSCFTKNLNVTESELDKLTFAQLLEEILPLHNTVIVDQYFEYLYMMEVISCIPDGFMKKYTFVRKDDSNED
ncbi:MAG: hypothetical protein ACI396_10680 [Acutalibacteraceae bacterium]